MHQAYRAHMKVRSQITTDWSLHQYFTLIIHVVTADVLIDHYRLHNKLTDPRIETQMQFLLTLM